MSMYYWGITGFGFEDVQSIISEEKINALYGNKESELDLHDFAFEIFKSKENVFSFSNDGNGRFFFLYSQTLPWALTETEKAFTCKQDIADAMYQELKDVLDDNITVDYFRNNIDWVSTYGAS